MHSLSFKARFAPLVESGEKRQTIRANRKRPFEVGDRLYLYTGMRTKACRKLGESIVTITADIHIYATNRGHCRVAINGIKVPTDSIETIAIRDGFTCSKEMIAWFRDAHGLPFDGQLIRWGEIER